MTLSLGAPHKLLPLVASSTVVLMIKRFWLVKWSPKTTYLKGCMTGWKLLIARHHLATFNSQGPCGSRNMTYSICHVTSRDHMFRGFCDIASESHFIVITTLSRLMAICLWSWKILLISFVMWLCMATFHANAIKNSNPLKAQVRKRLQDTQRYANKNSQVLAPRKELQD